MHDTVGRIISANICCKMVCSAESEDCKNTKDNFPGKTCSFYKGCNDCCCYIIPEAIIFSVTTPDQLVYFISDNGDLSSFQSDCFHPPEVV